MTAPITVRPQVVAIIDANEVTAAPIRGVLERAGFAIVSADVRDIRRRKLDFNAFIERHRPRVVVFDIAPPCERSYRVFQILRAIASQRDCRFVLTSTRAVDMQKWVGDDERVYEVLQKPLDPGITAGAVKRLLAPG